MSRFILLQLSLFFSVFLSAQIPHPASALTSAPSQNSSDPISFSVRDNGIDAKWGSSLLQITALSDSVLRIRESHSGPLPEDASWAVLASARSARVQVTQTTDGFQTKNLRVAISSNFRITVTDLDGNVIQQDAEPIQWDGSRFRIYKRKEPDAHFFGLGDKPGPLDRTGQSYVMWNSDSYGWQESTDPLYKSIPFFIQFRAGKAMGLFFDNTWRTFFDFGHELPDEYSFGAPNGPIDYYLMYGPDPKQVLASYAWLTGPTPLPPLWSLGYQQSRYSYPTETRLLQIANRLRKDHIPADALYLDIDYQIKYRPFTVDEQAFPQFSRMVKKLADKQFHLVVITDLHIPQLPHSAYAPYDSGAAADHFVKNPDGSSYVGAVWPGLCVFPEFTQHQTRQWWSTLYQQFVADGISGFWNDMNEPAVFRYPSKTMPDDVQHRIDEPGFQKRVANHLEIHNVYGMENARATYDGVLALRPNERPFVLTRATYAGGQRYAATWTGDNSSTWNHMRQTTPQLLNLGLSGFAMAGADVGGFAGSPTPDLLTKWLELAAFQPIDRDHAVKGSRDREPWVDGPEQESIRRKYIQERYRLMPYLYTVAEEASRDGMPIIRPLFVEFPHAADDGHPMDLDAQGEFFFGADLLVAPNPSPEEQSAYQVHLPPGVWYDYWSGQRLDLRASVESHDLEKHNDAKNDEAQIQKFLIITPKLDTLPIYVRGGSIIPFSPLAESTGSIPRGPLTLRVYTAAADGSVATAALCQGDIYLDDGHTFKYQNGAFLRMHFSCHPNQDGSLVLSISKVQGSYPPWWNRVRLEIYGWQLKKSTGTVVYGANHSNTQIQLHRSGIFYSTEIDQNPDGAQITIR